MGAEMLSIFIFVERGSKMKNSNMILAFVLLGMSLIWGLIYWFFIV